MIIYMQIITRQSVQENKDKIYVFGDNFARKGYGGQAKAMRGESNAIGIATKKSPKKYLTDNDFDEFKKEVDLKVGLLRDHKLAGKDIVFPLDGIGTGLAKLKEKAPRCFEYLYLSLINIGIKNGR